MCFHNYTKPAWRAFLPFWMCLNFSLVIPRLSCRAVGPSREQTSFCPVASCVLVGWLLQGHLQAAWTPRWSQHPGGNNVSRSCPLSTHTDLTPTGRNRKPGPPFSKLFIDDWRVSFPGSMILDLRRTCAERARWPSCRAESWSCSAPPISSRGPWATPLCFWVR